MSEFIPGVLSEKRVSSKISNDLIRLSRFTSSPGRSTEIAGNVVDTTSERYLTRNNLVAITAVANTQADLLLEDLRSIGISQASRFGKSVSGWIPISSIPLLEAAPNLKLARIEYKPITTSRLAESLALNDGPIANIGRVTSQGDAAQRSNAARSEFNVSGKGVTVGVLSDSFNARNEVQNDIASGDLPSAGVLVLQDLPGEADEGRAMLQIIHDIAPDAKLAFNTAFTGQAGFANGILNLAKPTSQGGAGAKVIVDDIGYFAEPFFQDGIVAQAVNKVASNGSVAYFSSAGNNASQSYEIAWNGNLSQGGFIWHDFDRAAGTADYFQNITIATDSSFAPAFQWDQPFASVSTTGKGSANDLDIFLLRNPVFDFSSSNVIASSEDFNIGGDPFEFLEGTNNGSSSTTVYLAIGQFTGSGGGGPAPGRIKYVDFGQGLNTFEYATNSPTSVGHPQSAFGLGVAAADYRKTPAFGQTPPLPEPFTSLGGTPILFDTAGNRLPVPENRNQPGITAPDGVSTTVPGFETFFGTSAAAPSAAAVAALILEKVPNATNQQIYNALKSTAIDMAAPGFDALTGAGLIQADLAIRALAGIGPTPPPGPTTRPVVSLAVAPLSVLEDGTTNLVYTFTRTGPTTDALTVNYTVGGTAKLGTDYTGISSSGTTKTISIAAGAATATVTVDPTPDFTAEANETVSLTIASGTAYTIGTTAAVTGTITNDDIIGTVSANILIGTAINEFIDGRSGTDSLTGGVGPDRFGFRFGESRVTSPDRIADFEFGSDKVTLLTSFGTSIAPPVAFSRAADNSSASTLSALASSVFTDADGALVGNQALLASGAVLVNATNPAIAGTYLFVNNNTQSLSTTFDVLINLTGFTGTLPALGSIAVDSVFL